MDSIIYNYDLATRQKEINDYAYQNKLDTLFFLQLLFVSILIVAIFAYLASIEVISYLLVAYIALIILIIDILLFLSRYSFTTKIRDQNRWNEVKSGHMPSIAYQFKTEADLAALYAKYGLTNLSGIDLQGVCSLYAKNQKAS
jgi:hypothetical protein